MRSQGAVWPGPEAPLPAFTSGQKPDPGLMANCRGQPFSELLLQVLLVPSLPPSALHIKGRQRSLFTPHFTQMAPHRSTPPTPAQGPGGEGLPGTASVPLASCFPTTKAAVRETLLLLSSNWVTEAQRG